MKADTQRPGLLGLPGVVCVSGGGSKTLAKIVISHLEVILLPSALFTQHPISFIQLNKLTMEARVRRVTVRVKLNKQKCSFNKCVTFQQKL